MAAAAILLPRCETPRPVRKGSSALSPPPELRAAKQARTAEPILVAMKNCDLASLAAIVDDEPLALCRLLRDPGEPALLFALRSGYSPSVVKALLEFGADANAKGRDGASALELVARVGLPTSLLTGHGAAVSASPDLRVLALRGLCGSLPTHGSPTAAAAQRPTWPGGSVAEQLYAVLGAAAASLMTAPLSEATCCEYAIALLQHGFEVGGEDDALSLGAVCAGIAEGSGRHKLANLIRNWNGRQVEAVRSLICSNDKSLGEASAKAVVLEDAAAGNRNSMGIASLSRAGSASPSLLDLPATIHEHIFDMLAPSYASLLAAP
mmetsp:Transcript_89253/g.257393  ORF Transcript_89253/g.257393 Transcript_89253/m.257393 type:complete len:323 (+) Transcript_89253:67-1035(+)